MITRRTALMGAALAATSSAILASQQTSASESMTPEAAKVELAGMARKKVKLVPPPFVHAHEQATTEPPCVVEFEMNIIEQEMPVDEDGAMIQGMTFDGSIPGPLMVVHEGDYVELTLINPPENAMQHNIDFHSATGGLGGGALTLVNPGEKTILRFKADRPGTFVYHCAPGGPMIPWHVVSGMSGAIMILPRDGLKDHNQQPVRYDQVFYVGENDFYIPKDENGEYMRFEDPGQFLFRHAGSYEQANSFPCGV